MSSRYTGEKGMSTPQNSQAARWVRRASPVKPPGNRSPAWTKLFILTAMISDASVTRTRRNRISLTGDRTAFSDIAASSILLVYFTSANTSRFFIKYSTPE